MLNLDVGTEELEEEGNEGKTDERKKDEWIGGWMYELWVGGWTDELIDGRMYGKGLKKKRFENCK